MARRSRIAPELGERRLGTLQDVARSRIIHGERDHLLELRSRPSVVVAGTLPQEDAEVVVAFDVVLVRLENVADKLDSLVGLPRVEEQRGFVDFGVVVGGGNL
jgi:hypothetical protein